MDLLQKSRGFGDSHDTKGQWDRDERAYIQEMVRRAIGFTVRIS